MNLKFSIIIPVYNVEKYLYQCINSCEEQNIDKSEYEIIAINDGSTDDSGLILDELSHIYTNLIVVNQSNCGLSKTRNVGVSISRGKYIWFVDSDDWIEKDILNSVYTELEVNNLECLSLLHRVVEEDGEYGIVNYSERGISFKTISGLEFISNYLKETFYVPSFVFKRDFWVNNSFYFKEGIYYEDLELIPKVILTTMRIKSFDRFVYNYRQRPSSIVHKISYKNIDDLYSIICAYDKSLTHINDLSVKKIYYRIIVIGIISYLVLLSKMPKTIEIEQRLSCLKTKFHSLPLVSRIPLPKSICILIYNISLRLLFKILYIKNKIFNNQ